MFVIIGGVVVAGVAAYTLGIFDRPVFEFHKTLVDDSNQSFLYAILALSTEKRIGRHIERLIIAVKSGIEKSIPDADERMKNAAKHYGSIVPDGKLSLGLYFDDPLAVPNPRWGAGCAIQAESYDDLEIFITEIQKNSGLSEPIRVVRVGMGSSVLKGRLPVRTIYSLLVAPLIQWSRAFNAMKDGGYSAFHDRNDESSTAPALEVYMTNSKDSVAAIDYIILLNDVSTTWNDTYPKECNETTNVGVSSI